MTFFTKLHPCWGVWCPWTCSGAPVHGNQNELRTQSGPLGQEHTSFFLWHNFSPVLFEAIFGLLISMRFSWVNVMISSLQAVKAIAPVFLPSIQYLCPLHTQHSSFGLFSVFQSPKHYFNPWPAEFSVQVWSPLSYFQQTTSLKCRIRLHSTTLTEWSRGCYYL